MQAAEERRKRLKLMREAGDAEGTATGVPSTVGGLHNPFTAAAAPSTTPSFNYYSDPLAAVAARPRQQLQADDQEGFQSSSHGLPMPDARHGTSFREVGAPDRQHVAPLQSATTWQLQARPPQSGPRPPSSSVTFARPPGLLPPTQQNFMHQAGSTFVQHRPRPPPPLPPPQPHQQASGQLQYAGRGRGRGQPYGPPAGSSGRGGPFHEQQLDGSGVRGRGRGRGRGSGAGYNDPVGPAVVACSPSMLEDPWRALLGGV